MGTVVMHDVVSLGGFIADENDDPGPLHEWYFSGDPPITADDDDGFDHSGVGSRFRVSSASPYVRSMWGSIGTIVMGRRLFDLTNEAQDLAGDRTIAVNAGEVGGQIFAAGHVDEVAMDLVPVVFGSGKRYFGSIDGQHLLEDPDVVIPGERVLHLRFKVRR